MIIDVLDEFSIQAAEVWCRNSISIWKQHGLTGITGLLSGAWDLLHYNHIRMITDCSRLCDILIIGVGTDRLVRENKGNDRPIIHQLERLNLINELRNVSLCFLMDSEYDYGIVAKELIVSLGGVHFKSKEWANKYETIPGFNPDYVYDPGPDRKVSQSIGNVILLEHGAPGTVSTTSIIEKIQGRK